MNQEALLAKSTEVMAKRDPVSHRSLQENLLQLPPVDMQLL
jgi:hypothetical protein